MEYIIVAGFLVWLILSITIVTFSLFMALFSKSKIAIRILSAWILITFVLFLMSILFRK